MNPYESPSVPNEKKPWKMSKSAIYLFLVLFVTWIVGIGIFHVIDLHTQLDKRNATIEFLMKHIQNEVNSR